MMPVDDLGQKPCTSINMEVQAQDTTGRSAIQYVRVRESVSRTTFGRQHSASTGSGFGPYNIHHVSSISARDVIMLLHYNQSSKLWALFSGTRGDQLSINTSQPNLSRQVAAVVGGWVSLLEQACDIVVIRRWSCDPIDLDNEPIKRIVYIMITLYRPIALPSGNIQTIGNLGFIVEALRAYGAQFRTASRSHY
ncbi:hypothetical protein BDD12DRAFT_286529 [Trichophaea hybrida]|nr:hypothetical protein BDD12DRAFT_286529 [Trichophaea hybrida]